MGEVDSVFHDNNGDRTKALYARLLAIGPAGAIAVNLLRASKNSRGGKNRHYRGRGRAAAYASKDWAIGELCRELVKYADDLGIEWGWGYDAKAIGYEHVLYVELPGQGQVSFHASYRRDGHDYGKKWDGVKDVAPSRVIGWAQFLLNGGKDDVERRDGTAGAPTARATGGPVRAESGDAEGGGEQQAFDV